ncbi:hypothetical protein R3P38DRAFT_3519271 [Favolaschia claudopus]|uniref:Uncharacterized protein n=1 Tax=Favolaschia claudopus TaxID=2862362 RepID=A0AAW0BRV1_9AGAR
MGKKERRWERKESSSGPEAQIRCVLMNASKLSNCFLWRRRRRHGREDVGRGGGPSGEEEASEEDRGVDGMGWAANGAVYDTKRCPRRLPYPSLTPSDLCISHVYSVYSGPIPSHILATALTSTLNQKEKTANGLPLIARTQVSPLPSPPLPVALGPETPHRLPPRRTRLAAVALWVAPRTCKTVSLTMMQRRFTQLARRRRADPPSMRPSSLSSGLGAGYTHVDVVIVPPGFTISHLDGAHGEGESGFEGRSVADPGIGGERQDEDEEGEGVPYSLARPCLDTTRLHRPSPTSAFVAYFALPSSRCQPEQLDGRNEGVGVGAVADGDDDVYTDARGRGRGGCECAWARGGVGREAADTAAGL